MTRRIFGVLAVLAWGGQAAAAAAPEPAAGAAPAAPPVRLVAPAQGAVLAAGSAAELEWAPLAAFGDLGLVEEWEAFLSLDGGSTYPYRITPHLNLGLRRFTWRVPAIPTPEARILLRFGDESREVGFESAAHFAVVRAADAWLSEPLSMRLVPGEAARPGDPGVVSWVEGSRSGAGLVWVAAAPGPALSSIPGASRPGSAPEHLLVLLEPESPEPPPAPSARSRAAAVPAHHRHLAQSRTPHPRPVDILLLTERQNE